MPFETIMFSNRLQRDQIDFLTYRDRFNRLSRLVVIENARICSHSRAFIFLHETSRLKVFFDICSSFEDIYLLYYFTKPYVHVRLVHINIWRIVTLFKLSLQHACNP